MKVIGVIPARYGSSRFPGKPLADIAGKSMIQRTYESASKCSALDHVIVATDHRDIMDEVNSFGGHAVMTSADHQSGTDRCYEALSLSGIDATHVVNIQGDEPLIPAKMIEQVVSLFNDDAVQIGTLVEKITDVDMLFDPNKVKAVLGQNGQALYFSRSAIPHLRHVKKEHWAEKHNFFKHVGLYAYQTPILKEICALEPAILEQAESLEQLRWLEFGYNIYAATTDLVSPSVDNHEDLENLLLNYKNNLD